MKIKKLIKMLTELESNKDILIGTDEEGNALHKDAYIDRYNRDYYRLYVVKGTEEDL